MKIKFHLYIIISSFLAYSCQNEQTTNIDKEINKMEKLEFDFLKGKKVFFGHQSVGNNMINGLNTLIENNDDLNFIKVLTIENYLKLENKDDDSLFYFIHTRIGENGHPQKKIDDFKKNIQILHEVDAAFMKFCYADIRPHSNIESIYTNYKSAHIELSNEFKNTKFIYFTVPVTAKQGTIKRVIKSIVGKEDQNINRFKYNELLRNDSIQYLFDIAFHESNNNLSKSKGIEYLKKEYTYDENHLNETGSKYIVSLLINFLNKSLKDE